MSTSPYVPFYTSDFLGGTSGMTASTKGVYITLLCLMYEAEAPLPQKWDTLARRCGCTLPAFKRAVQDLCDDGKVVILDEGIWSEKCEKHITQRGERRSSAKAAAETRWEKTKQKQGKADAKAMRTQCQPEPEPEPYKKRDTNVSLKDASGFEEFWSVVPKKVGKASAQKAWAKACKSDDPQTIIDGMRRYAFEREGKDPQYTAHPASWLNAGRWTDEASTTQQDFHKLVSQALEGPNAISGPGEIDHRQTQRISAPLQTPGPSGPECGPDRTSGNRGGNERAYADIIRPRRFGGADY